MIVSEKYKFAFFANPKTGTTTIEQLLCAHGQKISGVPSWGEPYGIVANSTTHVTPKDFMEHINKKRSLRWYPCPYSPPHSRNGPFVLPGSMDDFLKFSFVRNPWDRIVSNYKFADSYANKGFWESDYVLDDDFRYVPRYDLQVSGRLKGGPQIKTKSFAEYLRAELNPMAVGNSIDFLSDGNGKIIVDFIGRFENLQKDFDTVCERIGIPQYKLSHQNKTNHRHYTEYYNDETREIVAEKCAKDIEYFGYEFGK